MSDSLITANLRDNMMREFSAGIAKLRYELDKNLAEIDVLNNDKLQNTISIFNKRLTLFQHDFLQIIAQTRGTAPNNTKDLNIKANGRSHLPTLLGGIAGAFGGSTAAGLVVTTVNTGMWWWASTQSITLATSVATAIGASVNLVVAGLILLGGVLGAIIVNKAVGSTIRRRLRDKVITAFDKQVVPKLTSWAQNILNE